MKFDLDDWLNPVVYYWFRCFQVNQMKRIDGISNRWLNLHLILLEVENFQMMMRFVRCLVWHFLDWKHWFIKHEQRIDPSIANDFTWAQSFCGDLSNCFRHFWKCDEHINFQSTFVAFKSVFALLFGFVNQQSFLSLCRYINSNVVKWMEYRSFEFKFNSLSFKNFSRLHVSVFNSMVRRFSEYRSILFKLSHDASTSMEQLDDCSKIDQFNDRSC